MNKLKILFATLLCLFNKGIAGQVETISTIRPSNTLYEIKEFPDATTILLDDDSEWCFELLDLPIVDSWKEGQTVVISPKLYWWLWDVKHMYVMTNRDTKQSIDVRLFDGPIAHGQHTPWVAATDWVNGHLYVKHAGGFETTWAVAPSDISLMKEWSSNQSLIIGENTSWLWFFSEHRQIIFNVELNHYIRAHLLSTKRVSFEETETESPSLEE
jgi:hypothetical protein